MDSPDGSTRTQLYDLRARALQAAIDSLEPRPRGRPSKTIAGADVHRELIELRERIRHLERELDLARARTVINGILVERERGPPSA